MEVPYQERSSYPPIAAHHEYDEDEEDFKTKSNSRQARVTALILGLLTLGAISIGVYFFMDKNDYDIRQDNSSAVASQGSVALEEIAEHTEPEDCWMGLHGNAYDLTEYIPQHPGSPEIITRYCGIDASVFYDFEHSVVLLPIVDQFKLGTLAESTTAAPSKAPISPTITPTSSPTSHPSSSPTISPSSAPISPPTRSPTPQPTVTPGNPTLTPSTEPTLAPVLPSTSPTLSPSISTDSPTSLPTIEVCAMDYYTEADLSAHGDADSCWYGLYGVVYDLTTYVDEHKGGRATILPDCGSAATVNFEEEKKHDADMLEKKGFADFIIGRLGDSSGQRNVPCDELELVAVTGVGRK